MVKGENDMVWQRLNAQFYKLVETLNNKKNYICQEQSSSPNKHASTSTNIDVDALLNDLNSLLQ
jgi:macrodomain Ter protein organizer (MatP/YcbG family)